MTRPLRARIGVLARRIPPVARLLRDRDRWRRHARRQQHRADRLEQANTELRRRLELAQRHLPAGSRRVEQLYRPGHFYSPIPDLNEVSARESEIFDRNPQTLPGVDLRVEDQRALVPVLGSYYADQPFGEQPTDELRYGLDNDYFAHGDGLVLQAMLRHLRPGRVVEVGSGWSSALLLDVNERFLDGSMHLTFVEPYPDRLRGLLRPTDRDRVEILDSPLHEISDDVFAGLTAGDLLFIDSTHVSRVGSDVNRLLLEIVPSLPAGVHVHVHDVFWPFEYPAAWVYQGRAWNEDYLLRALLIHNPRLEITWFAQYMSRNHGDEVHAAMPLWSRNPGGSLYLRAG